MQTDKITSIRTWLGTGSINIFGLPMSGKDTVGTRLAATLGAQFLSSGDILRANNISIINTGVLAPTDQFQQLILPHFSRPEYADKPFVLSSVGRWSGEENAVLEALEQASHPLRAVLLLDISENDVWARWESVKILADRHNRSDDQERAIFQTRLNEFYDKTAPVLTHYQQLGLLVHVPANATRDQVFTSVLEKLYNFTLSSS